MRPLWLLMALLLASCANDAYRGAPLNLKNITAPDNVETPMLVPTPTLPPSAAPKARQVWRAWIPRQVQPNGDAIAGHVLEVAPTPPAVETVQPAMILPRAPLMQYPVKTPEPNAPHQAPAARPEARSAPAQGSPILPPQWPGMPGQMRPGMPGLVAPQYPSGAMPVPGGE